MDMELCGGSGSGSSHSQPPPSKLLRIHQSHSFPGVPVRETTHELPHASLSMPPGPGTTSAHLGAGSKRPASFAGHFGPSPVPPVPEEPPLFLLPSTPASGDSFRRISPDTLVALARGDFHDRIDAFHIVDCRFPYEFEGGHIAAAQNITSGQSLEERFFANVPAHSHRTAIIFHCEYSAQRAPQMARHMRCHDRNVNAMAYPNLHYPHIYILKGGYREFYATHMVRGPACLPSFPPCCMMSGMLIRPPPPPPPWPPRRAHGRRRGAGRGRPRR
jgi:rhodanese-related sulfurtransferase